MTLDLKSNLVFRALRSQITVLSDVKISTVKRMRPMSVLQLLVDSLKSTKRPETFELLLRKGRHSQPEFARTARLHTMEVYNILCIYGHLFDPGKT